MTTSPQRTGNHNHHVQLLWIAILAVAVITFLVDAIGWFHTGW